MGKLLLPGERDEEVMPMSMKMFLFGLSFAVIASIMFNQCSVPEANAFNVGEQETLSRKTVQTLDEISSSLKDISSTLKDMKRELDK